MSHLYHYNLAQFEKAYHTNLQNQKRAAAKHSSDVTVATALARSNPIFQGETLGDVQLQHETFERNKRIVCLRGRITDAVKCCMMSRPIVKCVHISNEYVGDPEIVRLLQKWLRDDQNLPNATVTFMNATTLPECRLRITW